MCRNSTFGKIRNKSIKGVFRPEDSRSRKEKSRRPTGGPHLAQARAHPWPRLGVVWPPVWPPDLPFGLYPPFDLKTPKIGSDFEKEFCSAAAIPKPQIGIRSLRSGTLPGWGIGGDHHRHHHQCLFINHP